ncbi:MAG: hypothetical protein PHC64_02045 [Candidatus Gastranaerophilales bacterium]|nr:hypothetical protein [Candidatus Gastranaerophilales bacterium]
MIKAINNVKHFYPTQNKSKDLRHNTTSFGSSATSQLGDVLIANSRLGVILMTLLERVASFVESKPPAKVILNPVVASKRVLEKTLKGLNTPDKAEYLERALALKPGKIMEIKLDTFSCLSRRVAKSVEAILQGNEDVKLYPDNPVALVISGGKEGPFVSEVKILHANGEDPSFSVIFTPEGIPVSIQLPKQ